MNAKQSFYIEVILPLPLPGTFTYLVTDFTLSPANLIGCRVIVPFGKRKIYTGLVLSTKKNFEENTGYQPREIKEIIDDTPIVSEKQLEFLLWMSSYYMAALGDVYNAALPSHLKLTSDSFVGLISEINPFELDLKPSEQRIIEILAAGDQTIDELKKLLSSSHPQKAIKSLGEQGLVFLYERVKDKYAPKKESRVRLSANWNNELKLNQLSDLLSAKTKQMDVLVHYLQHVNVLEDVASNNTGISKKQLVFSVSSSSLKTLIKNGYFEEFEQKIDRFNYTSKISIEIPQLSDYQQDKIKEIRGHFSDKNTVLLKGITGSGKTELYMHLIKEQIDQGHFALLLLPEIALTTQIVARFKKVFGDAFAVYHSRFSDNERAEIYQNCLGGKYQFVIGVRSAVFLPFDQLSLIIVDEEHEYSYKQYDPAPRYHARDAAVYLGHLHKAKVLLGSATPSLESYYNAQEEKYGYTIMDRRFKDQPLPEIATIDLKKARKQRKIKGHFTNELLDSIQKTVSSGKQVILFQNQRGYAPFIQCENCANVPKCPNCAVSLTYHIYQNQLICHYCGYKEFMESNCSSCNQDTLKTMGAGTEQIEEELQIMTPDLRIKRMDLDTTRSKYAYQEIIDSFESGAIDVLIGTQMVSKGLDFEHVELVGVFDADRIIHFPDFRSHERAFQLITQVSGRAGRQHNRGSVMIQTSDPSQPILQHIREGHLDLFYRQELNERRSFKYPPFYRMIKVIIRHKEKEVAYQAAMKYHLLIHQTLGNERLLGPIEPIINRIRNQFIVEIHIKLEKNIKNLQAIKDYLLGSKLSLVALSDYKSVLVHFDVDPL